MENCFNVTHLAINSIPSLSKISIRGNKIDVEQLSPNLLVIGKTEQHVRTYQAICIRG